MTLRLVAVQMLTTADEMEQMWVTAQF